MGCRLCFVVNLVEEFLGEGGSQSAQRAHENDSFQTLFHNIKWQSRDSEVDLNLV